MAPKSITWSEWVYSEQYNQFYREATDRHGRVVNTEWHQPRADEADQLADQMHQVSIDSQYSEEPAYTYNTSSAADATLEDEEYSDSPPAASYPSTKGKEKATDTGRKPSKSTSTKPSTSNKDKDRDRDHDRDRNRDRDRDRDRDKDRDRNKDKERGKDKDRDRDRVRDRDQRQRTHTTSSRASAPEASSSSKPRRSEPEIDPQAQSSFIEDSETTTYYDDDFDDASTTHQSEPYAHQEPSPVHSSDAKAQPGEPVQMQTNPRKGGKGTAQPRLINNKTKQSTSRTVPKYPQPSPQQSSSYHGSESLLQEGESYGEEDMSEYMAAAQEMGWEAGGERPANFAANYVPAESEGSRTPRPRSPKFDISGTDGEYEDLDPRYVIETSNRFYPGEVFKVLWPEPLGEGRGRGSIFSVNTLRDPFGGNIYVGIRRFIIIGNDEGHCTCIPIFTYGGKGCTKGGVKPAKHGIIYEAGTKAQKVHKEPDLGFKPVRMSIEENGEKLSPESRVNYSKLITVEHNVKVFFIGSIVTEDFNNIVRAAVDKCWTEKTRKPKKKSHR